MPATTADIAAGTRESVTVTWEDAAIRTRYPGAEDGLKSPLDSWLDSANDAQTLVNAKGAIFGVERGRFAVDLDGLQWLDPSSSLPQVQLIDTEQAVNRACIAPRYAVNLEAETSSLELLG